MSSCGLFFAPALLVRVVARLRRTRGLCLNRSRAMPCYTEDRTMTPEQAIHELIANEAAVPVIFAERDAAPPKPYIALKLQESTRLPLHLGPVAPNGMRAASSHRDALIQLTYLGADGMEAMDTLTQRLQMERALVRADALNLAVFAVGKAEQVPLLLDDGTFESRTRMEVGVRYTVMLEEDVGLIETVNADGTTAEGERP